MKSTSLLTPIKNMISISKFSPKKLDMAPANELLESGKKLFEAKDLFETGKGILEIGTDVFEAAKDKGSELLLPMDGLIESGKEKLQ